MSKHKRIFKLKLAQLAEQENSEALSRKYNISARLIRYWFQVYLLNGSKSFIHKQLPYSGGFKIHVLETMEINDWSLGYTSAYVDLSSPGILFHWQKLYAHGGITQLKPQKKGRPRVTNHSSSPKPSASTSSCDGL